MSDQPIITRFAPSPTGYFHAGSYRTALFAWIFARQNNGKFILRIEDTDKERSKREYEENIIESLKWLGLNYDEFYRQSDRTEIYKKYIQQLIDSGHAYVSKEEPREESSSAGIQKSTRTEVIRFKNPKKKVRFDDLIRGPIEFDTTELGDFVIAKSMNEPVFHLVVVVDDHEMKVTHIIRGEDHISNTPRQILIYEALNAPLPKYAHIPLLLAQDKSKLSKRNGAVAVTEYRNRGYLPEAVVNYLALLGWHPSDDREVLTTEEIIKDFTLDRIQKGGAVFDEEKLAWFNRQYIIKISAVDFSEHVAAFIPEWLSSRSPIFQRLLPVLKDKVMRLSEVTEMLSPTGELGFIKELPSYPQDLLLWKKNPDPAASKTHLEKAKEVLGGLAENNF
ncbi:MAG: glutamate--tRNA ligase family protein, partial [Patescibacteria group bacterium]